MLKRFRRRADIIANCEQDGESLGFSQFSHVIPSWDCEKFEGHRFMIMRKWLR